MNGFLLALVPPFLWAVANHLEKYTISNYFKKAGVGTMMIFSSFIAIFVLPFSFLLQTNAFSIAPLTALLIALNGCLYLSATFPYLKALKLNDASAVVPIFQLIPVISFVLGYIFLGETLTGDQLVGGALIVLGAIVISLEMSEEKKYKLRKDVLLLMALSSLIYSFHFLFFKMFAVNTQFWTAEFWENIGFIGFGLMLILFIKNYRREFKEVMKANGKAVLAINSVNEVVNITAKMVFNYASLLVPIALSWVAVGFQPVFVLAISIFLTIFFPHISKEKVLGKHLLQKIICIIVMTIGVYILH